MKIKEFNQLTTSEIKKVNKAGNGKIAEYYTTPSEIEGFKVVTCSVFDNTYDHIVATVELIVCLFDRRKSWVSNVIKSSRV